MQRLLSILVVLAWGLWFGGIVMVFITVQSIFATFQANRAGAGATASGVFQRFEVYQLALAAGVLLAMLAWRLLSAHSWIKNSLLIFFALATTIAMIETLAISSRIEWLRTQGETAGEGFKRLHGISMSLYGSEALLLLVAGALLPVAIFRDLPRVPRVAPRPDTDDAAAPSQPATSS